MAEKLLGFVGLQDRFAPWLGMEDTALPAIALMSVWQFVGVPMMLLYAALIAIPEEVVEAAQVEGASPWRIFWAIRLPLILPMALMLGLMLAVGRLYRDSEMPVLASVGIGPKRLLKPVLGLVLPVAMLEVISLTPAMAPSRRSSGAATVCAIVSGLAPGRLADTTMVGNSTCGRGATGSSR